MNDIKTKQQIVEKIKTSTNILVTVSTDPSVDDLSAALALTVMLNKMGKHATAVFSGAVPPAITFLDPEKTFEATTDSLRDFIIALDKEKADHLRYKVEGDSVKIFITPYRTTITSEDLNFSQGDYNVELVLALGVNDQDHLDSALEAHGRILHDATVITISAGTETSQLGSLDWHDDQASSLSEMLVSLGESMKSDKPLLDQQIATALLTGIVASTDRFSNPRTTSKVMTIAAQLMAAGADQQLIAAKLQESHEIGQLTTSPNTQGQTDLVQDQSSKIDKQAEPTPSKDGGLDITHDTLDQVAEKVRTSNSEAAEDEAEQQLAAQQNKIDPDQPAPEEKLPETDTPAAPQTMTGAVNWQPSTEPSFGGTLNATTEQAEEDTRRQMADDQNKTILSHTYLNESPNYNAPINGATQPSDEGSNVDMFAGEATPPADTFDRPLNATPYPVIPAPEGLTLADIDAKNRSEPQPVFEPYAPEPAEQPAPQPFDLPSEPVNLPQPPPLPDFSTLPPPTLSPAYAPEPTETERLGDIFAPEQPQAPEESPTQPPADTNNDPSQFKIPGQQ